MNSKNSQKYTIILLLYFQQIPSPPPQKDHKICICILTFIQYIEKSIYKKCFSTKKFVDIIIDLSLMESMHDMQL